MIELVAVLFTSIISIATLGMIAVLGYVIFSSDKESK